MNNLELIALNIMRFKNNKRFKHLYALFQKDDLSRSSFSAEDIKTAEEELEKCKKNGVNLVTLDSDKYPERLKNIVDPPIALYIKGNLDVYRSVSIVGSRKCTEYGRSVAYKFAKEFAYYGVTVISGLANGIDSAAHIGAIHGNGKTVAVLGSGLDIVYPSSNKKLSENILHSGALISEFPFGTRPVKYNFPFRNRIISGLSLATIVVEAAKKSGSLITARFAAEQGREVFSVPGNITSRVSEGTNALIKDGAIPMTDVEDVISYIAELRELSQEKQYTEKLDFTTDEEKILSVIENSAETADAISEKVNIPLVKLTALLTLMEVKGIVKRSGGRYLKL